MGREPDLVVGGGGGGWPPLITFYCVWVLFLLCPAAAHPSRLLTAEISTLPGRLNSSLILTAGEPKC
jgi:hypothetical protein